MIRLNKEFFPDANFRGKLSVILRIREGDEITEEMISKTTFLDVSFCEIADLTGIEHFTALTYLGCDNNQLTSLAVSKNTALIWLSCKNNQLTALNVSKNIALTSLVCDFNQLTELDLSKNAALTYLRCGYNQLTSLDVSGCPFLSFVGCTDNHITEIKKLPNTPTNIEC